MNFFTQPLSTQQKIISCHRFLNAEDSTSRAFIAHQCYLGKQRWPYSFPLADVVWYLRLESMYKEPSEDVSKLFIETA